MDKKPITVEAVIKAPVEKVWEYWTEPAHINRWAHASDDWEAYGSENDLREGGNFKTTMAARDKSTSFDFTGTYTKVGEHERIEYTMDDGRKVSIKFESQNNDSTRVTETFDPESSNSQEMQRAGWQAILDNFKKYVEKSE